MKWKYYLAGIGTILLVIFIAGGAYFMGRRGVPEDGGSGSISPTPPPLTTSTLEDSEPSPTSHPIGTPVTVRVIEAGGAVSFPTYEIALDPGWTYDKQHDEAADSDTLTISKGDYEIRIMQGATGGLRCLYPGDPDFPGPNQRYDDFTEIVTTGGLNLRRGRTTGTTGFTVCEQSGSDFVTPTTYGHISYSTPTSPSEEILSQMDEMISSINSL